MRVLPLLASLAIALPVVGLQTSEKAGGPAALDFSFAPAEPLSLETVTFAATRSVRWTFGDGAGAEGASVSHAYGRPGEFVVAATHGRETVTRVVTVGNRAPDLLVSAPAVVGAGEPVELSATATDSDGAIQSVEWSFSDAAATGTTVLRSFAAGQHAVSVTAVDDLGAVATVAFVLQAAPAPPPPEPGCRVGFHIVRPDGTAARQDAFVVEVLDEASGVAAVAGGPAGLQAAFAPGDCRLGDPLLATIRLGEAAWTRRLAAPEDGLIVVAVPVPLRLTLRAPTEAPFPATSIPVDLALRWADGDAVARAPAWTRAVDSLGAQGPTTTFSVRAGEGHGAAYPRLYSAFPPGTTFVHAGAWMSGASVRASVVTEVAVASLELP